MNKWDIPLDRQDAKNFNHTYVIVKEKICSYKKLIILCFDYGHLTKTKLNKLKVT